MNETQGNDWSYKLGFATGEALATAIDAPKLHDMQTEAARLYAESVGKPPMTDEEKKQAFLDYALEREK